MEKKDLFIQENDVPADVQQREIIPDNVIMLEVQIESAQLTFSDFAESGMDADDCIIVRVDVPNDIAQFLGGLNSGVADDRQILFEFRYGSCFAAKSLTDERNAP